MNTYIIHYQAYDKNGRLLKHGKLRCKNKLSEFDAKCGGGKHLEKTIPNCARVTITACNIETVIGEMPNNLGDLFNQFFK
jgi:hypothetical protein